MLQKSFFNRDANHVAIDLLGKHIFHLVDGVWLIAQIIETESYYYHDRGSHAWLGKSPSREALFMPSGTIYMYFARGGDSLNISCRGDGNAVLIKSAIPILLHPRSIQLMQKNNPKNSGEYRIQEKLCSGQTLLCKSLGLRVHEWNKQQFHPDAFYIDKSKYVVKHYIQTTRLGIPSGRDDHLMQRFIDKKFVTLCTKNPLTMNKPPPFISKKWTVLES